jgi:hypothetical protein
MADLTSLPNLPDIPPPRIIYDKVHNARLALGLPNAPDDSSVVDLVAGADNSVATGLPDALVDVCVVNLLPHLPGIPPPRVTHDEVCNARLAPGLPDTLDDGRAANLFAGSDNNFDQGLSDAPVNGRVIDLLNRAENNDNNKRSLLLKTTGLSPQRKKQGAAISALPRIQAEMQLLALYADAGVKKQIIPSPAAVAADLSFLRSNDVGTNEDNDDTMRTIQPLPLTSIERFPPS